MVEGLTPKQRQQQEALKVLTDWCKWLAALETTAIGGIFFGISFLLKSPHPHLGFLVLPLAISAAFFCASIGGIAYLFYELPDIVEQLPSTHVSSINDMRANSLSVGLLWVQRWIYWTSAIAMGFLIVDMLSFPFWMSRF